MFCRAAPVTPVAGRHLRSHVARLVRSVGARAGAQRCLRLAENATTLAIARPAERHARALASAGQPVSTNTTKCHGMAITIITHELVLSSNTVDC